MLGVSGSAVGGWWLAIGRIGRWNFHLLANGIFQFVAYVGVFLQEDAGIVATLTQALMTLTLGTAAEARVPNLGASGAIAAVLGAYFILYPSSTVFGLIVVFPVRISAWFFLGFWFLYQLFEANFGLFNATSNGGGTAFFAHVGGFVFGYVVATTLVGAGRVTSEAPALGVS